MTRAQCATIARGEYLAEYADDSYDDRTDSGSRCGYGDGELAQIRDWLAPRGLTVRADDRGLRVVSVDAESGRVQL